MIELTNDEILLRAAGVMEVRDTNGMAPFVCLGH